MEPLESHVLFVRKDGLFEVGHINETDGRYVVTENGMGFSPNWTHVVAVGPHILLVRNDGHFEVGHIDQYNSQYAQTDSGTRFSDDWTHVVAVGPARPVRPQRRAVRGGTHQRNRRHVRGHR